MVSDKSLGINVVAGFRNGHSWGLLLIECRVVSYLVSAYTVSNYKWGFYAFGTISWLLLAFNTFSAGSSAKRVGVSRDHTLLSGWVNLLWLLYPIAFGLTDGGNRIGVTPGFIFFGILDVLLIPVLSFAFIFLARRWDYGQLNLGE